MKLVLDSEYRQSLIEQLPHFIAKLQKLEQGLKDAEDPENFRRLFEDDEFVNIESWLQKYLLEVECGGKFGALPLRCFIDKE